MIHYPPDVPVKDGEYMIEFARWPKPLLCDVIIFEDHIEVRMPHRHQWQRWETMEVKRFRAFNSFAFIEGRQW